MSTADRAVVIGCQKCGWQSEPCGMPPLCPGCGQRLTIFSGTKEEIEKQKEILTTLSQEIK